MKKTLLALALMLSLVAGGATVTSAQSAPNTSCVVINRNLMLGMSGSDVTTLQTYLASKGFLTVRPTGFFGLATKRAVAMYQASMSISPASGFVGVITRAKLASSCDSSTGNDPVTINNPKIPGCVDGALYNYLTGALCSGYTINVSVQGSSFAIDSNGNFSIPFSWNGTKPNGYPWAYLLSSTQDNSNPEGGAYASVYMQTLTNKYGGDGVITVANKLKDIPNGTYKIAVCDQTTDIKKPTCGGSTTFKLEKGVATVPSITVYSPVQGQEWNQGSTYTITWSTPNVDFDYYSVLLSNRVVPGVWGGVPVPTPVQKGQNSYTIDPRDLSDNLVKAWVANSKGTASEYDVRHNFYFTVEAHKNTGTEKDGPVLASGKSGVFSIVPATTVQEPSITVTSPNGGETWKMGETKTITWTSKNMTGNIYVDLWYPDGGVCGLGQAPVSAGQFSFKVSEVPCTNGLPRTISAGQYKAYLVQDAANNGYTKDASDNWFTIAAADVARKPGDANGDGVVNRMDLDILGDAYGTSVGDTKYNKNADFNNDGKVNLDDLVTIANNLTDTIVPSSYIVFPGDVTRDGNVNLDDLVALANSYGCVYGSSCYNLKADFNLDGKVNQYDLYFVSGNYGKSGTKEATYMDGDITHNGTVDLDDLVALANVLGSKVGDSTYNYNADFNKDGKIDTTDQAALSNNYGKSSTTGTVQGAFTSSSCVVITQALQKGSTDAYSGGEVTMLQNFLETQGYGFPEKGSFGSVTDAALKSWQGKQGIEQTGITGPLTREAIRTVSCK